MRAPAIVVLVVLFACGDNKKAAAPPDAVPTFCGNGLVEAGEDCDDDDTFKDNVCDATCHFTCGNGILDADVGELCDTAIASGAGSCPSDCDDGLSCTDDVVNSAACTAECFHSDITAPANGDSCCPTGANANNDSDCSPVCGNMVVETGEACDTGITTGPGRCPTTCNDMLVCTTDVLMGMGTCAAACSFTPITLPVNNDGCCPPGANQATDNDCVAVCGNMIVEPSETCDTGIPSGPGSCPTTCNDNNACTADSVGNAGTCQAVCSFQPITTPANNDGCCPAGANANNDNDCAPVCPNGIPEPGEQCDDGNMNNNDTCSNACTINVVPTAFRFSDLDLRDPHVFVSLLACNDVTDNTLFGFAVNSELQTSITTDSNDADNFLQLSPTLVFRPFSQTAATMPVELHFANCTAPIGSTMCSPGTGTVTMGTATNMTTGTCLAAIPGTVRPYNPAITSTAAPCFVTNPVTVTLSLGGIPITLRDAQVAGRYVGNPATTLSNGLLRGFISEADANATIIPPSFPLVGGKPLSELLAGGANSCPSHSDKDTNNGVVGWWFYLNFPAARVPWSD